MTRFFGFFCFVLLIGASPAAGQRLVDNEAGSVNSAAYYHYARSGDVTNLIHVWGAVAYPGLYEIPAASHLNQVLSLAGGPTFDERRRRSRRTVRVRLLRDEGGRQVVIYEGIMRNSMVVADPDPVLREGDTIVVEAEIRERFTFRDIFPVVAAIASAAVAIDRLAN